MRVAYGQAQGPRPRAQEVVPVAQVERFEDLIVWQKSMTLAEMVHRMVDSFPGNHRYGLGSQIRRSATSIPSNVAEGFSRRSQGSYRSHIAIASGSSGELRTQIELSRRLELLTSERARQLRELVEEIGRLLYGLWKALTIKAATKTVCYSVFLAAMILGLGPWAWGLTRFP